jgi:hypothetical protein
MMAKGVIIHLCLIHMILEHWKIVHLNALLYYHSVVIFLGKMEAVVITVQIK